MQRGRNQSGQALIEYIALLSITVLVIIGAVYQFNDAFRQYLNAWFDGENSYLFCLIEKGSLPGETELCTLPTFNLKNGKTLAGGIGGANASGGAAGGKGGRGGGGGASLSGDRFASHGGLIPYNAKGSLGAGAAGAAGAGGADKSGAGGAGATGDLDFSNVGSRKDSKGGKVDLSGLKGRNRSVPISGDLGGAKAQGSRNVPASERDLDPGRFVSAEKKKRSQNNYQDIDTSFSFGKILKYIIILLIGFSILFFVGSQLVAISRGNKKRS